MSVLVFGKTGQVGTELQRYIGVTALGRDTADLSDPASCAAAVHAYRPSAVINAAAYTAVDHAETEEALATVINAKAPAAMARACAERAIPFVHLSTDYVFDGTGTKPFAVDAPTAPLSAYGRSKLAGEKAVRAVGGVQAILRTSWVFSAHSENFVKTMLRLSETREALNVVADQIGGPTPARSIADACHTIAMQLIDDRDTSGIYHFSGAPNASWTDFAREIFAQAGRSMTVTPITTAEYGALADRPPNSRLDCSTTKTVFDIPRPDWRDGLTQVLRDMRILS